MGCVSSLKSGKGFQKGFMPNWKENFKLLN